MEKCVLIEYLSTLKAVICETFKSTQRIRLMSFDVSLQYIIFGASSGGIYIFKREPCQFLRLIPSKEGAIIHVSISQNEKNLAVASTRGLVIILENFFVDGNLRPHVYNEHEGNMITVMKWHGNDLYCGDDVGRISVFTIASLLTKAIFQTPSAILMHLDASITQIDTYKNYLLISNRTRTFLCNTEREQYKQIGKKLRDGNFGACFSNVNNTNSLGDHQPFRGNYRTIKESEEFASSLSNSHTKIFCSRPGSRLWEANFEASVLVTYQFRSSLEQKPSDIVVIQDSVDAKLYISKPDPERKVSKHFSFGKIYPILQRFILTYDGNGLYFFEPEMSELPFWSYTFTDILDIKIVKSYIYIWREGLEMNIVSLQSLEDLLITTLVNKQYYLCSELCLYYTDDFSALIEKSTKLHLLVVLKTKLVEIGADEMLNKLKPILDVLEQYYKKQSLGTKLENGIVIVDIQHSTENRENKKHLPDSLQKFNNVLDDSPILCKDQDEPEDTNLINYKIDNDMMALYRQYVLNKTHKNVELTETDRIFRTLHLDNQLMLFEQFTEFVKEKDNDDATMWCQEQMVKYIDKEDCNIDTFEMKSLQYLSESFIAINTSIDLYCKCNVPLPKAHTKKIVHHKLACKLFDRVENKNEYLNNIPFLYKYNLKKINSLNEVMLNLPGITQFSDKEVFKEFLRILTYDSWDEIIKLYMKLRRGCCLNCGENIDVDGTLTWSETGLLMVESIGSKNAIRLLNRYSQYIPNGELGAKFYQNCIFTTTCHDRGLAVDFIDKVVNGDNSLEFGEVIGKFILKRYLGNNFQFNNADMNNPAETCTVCNLPVNTSVLIEIKKCNCGHTYHSICFPTINGVCNICLMNSRDI